MVSIPTWPTPRPGLAGLVEDVRDSLEHSEGLFVETGPIELEVAKMSSEGVFLAIVILPGVKEEHGSDLGADLTSAVF